MKEYDPSFLHNKHNTIESTPTNGYDLTFHHSQQVAVIQ